MTISETRRAPGGIDDSISYNTEQQKFVGEISINDAINQFMQSKRFLRYSSTTRENYSRTLRRFEKSCEDDGISDLSQLSEEKDDEWIQGLKAKGTPKIKLGQMKPALSAFRRWRENLELTQIDPEKSRVLDEKEILQLMRTVTNLRDATLILIALRTGASLREILKLKKGDIDLKDEGQSSIYFEPTKNTNYRDILIDGDASEIIRMHIEKSTPRESSSLFGKTGKKLMSQDEAEEIIKRYGTMIGIADLDFSVLRRTFIYNFKGGSKRELEQVLGIQE